MKVMIVDDEAHVITAVKLLVPWNELGITQILEASNPQDAIRIMEQEQPEILITDIVMQDLSGIDLMEYVNHAPFRTKVVVISGYNNFEYVRGSLQNGGVDYLLKPLDQNQLIAAVHKAVSLPGTTGRSFVVYSSIPCRQNSFDDCLMQRKSAF